MVSHYLTNFAGDDAWIYRVRFEFRNFNYMGDVTWLIGTITDVRVDEKLIWKRAAPTSATRRILGHRRRFSSSRAS